jgi:FKBP-type peptidyl-prolyl cis-trans isomerase
VCGPRVQAEARREREEEERRQREEEKAERAIAKEAAERERFEEADRKATAEAAAAAAATMMESNVSDVWDEVSKSKLKIKLYASGPFGPKGGWLSTARQTLGRRGN